MHFQRTSKLKTFRTYHGPPPFKISTSSIQIFGTPITAILIEAEMLQKNKLGKGKQMHTEGRLHTQNYESCLKKIENSEFVKWRPELRKRSVRASLPSKKTEKMGSTQEMGAPCRIVPSQYWSYSRRNIPRNALSTVV